jgi:pilus assembly protein CpaC
MLTAGRSMVLTTAYDITRIAITDPKIADAVVVQPREVLIDGRSADGEPDRVGRGPARRCDVVVDPRDDAAATLQQVFPGEDIGSRSTTTRSSSRARSRQRRDAEAAECVSDQGQRQGRQHAAAARHGQPAGDAAGAAEVNRAALMEAGLTLFASAQRFSGRTTTRQFDLQDDTVPRRCSATSQPVLLRQARGLGAVLKALESKGYFQSLAEPA